MKKNDFVYYFRRRNDGAWRGRIEKIAGGAVRLFLIADNWGQRFVAPVGGRQIVHVQMSRLQPITDDNILMSCDQFAPEIPEERKRLQKEHRAQKRKDKREAV